MSHHRKLTMEKKIFPPLLQGFEPATFQSRVRRSNHRAIPAPQHLLAVVCAAAVVVVAVVCAADGVGVSSAADVAIIALASSACVLAFACICVCLYCGGGGGGGGGGAMFDMMTNLCMLLLCVVGCF